MSEETPAQAQPQVRLEVISRCFQRLIGLRAALAPFRATLQTLAERVQEPEGRRQLLALWRPCQERLDLLLDTAPKNAVRIHLLRQEVEDNLLDEVYSPVALTDLMDAFDQACEALLLEIGEDLRETVAALQEATAGKQGRAQ
ncbi:MAG TPA: hypothetical protein ENI37_02430 [Chloroflexi bacterium]|nr:hypothetical protein [Chloroflexota bacterium]